ncbi:hypothetical protein D3C87_1875810 [compost metagenome]
MKFFPFVVVSVFRIMPVALFPWPSDIQGFIDTVRAEHAGFVTLLLVFFWIQLALSVATLVWWIGPFIRWRGQTWYDRLVGCRVVAVQP